MAVTRADVARRAGVSPSLVSYVLNPGSRPVSSAARERIEEAIAELGYHPNAIAQALRRSSTRSIGLLIPNFTNPVVALVAEGIEAEARSRGYVILTGSTGGLPEREADYIRVFLSRHVDALVLISASSPDSLAAAAATGVPVLALDCIPTDLGVSSVLVEARGGAEAAVRHLIEAHGHKRIACIGAEWPARSHAQHRVIGWQTAHEKAGLSADPSLLITAKSFDRAGGRHAIGEVLDTTDATAVFVTSDIKAVGALDGLRARGVRVPDDLAVASFDGTMLAETTWPRLTTVNQFLPDYAVAVVDRLIAKLGKDGEGPTHDVLPTELIVRESCGC